jgi:hypothetical protein
MLLLLLLSNDIYVYYTHSQALPSNIVLPFEKLDQILRHIASLKCIMVSTNMINLLRENIYSCLMVLLFPASAIYISISSLHHQLFCITAKSLSNNSNLEHLGSQLQDFLGTQYSLSSTK